MANLEVSVTQALIDRATQRDSRHCMIAEAIKMARPHYQKVMVDLQTVRWTDPKTEKRYVCLTPELAARELVAFDQGDGIEPFTLRLEPIQVTAKSRQLRLGDGTVRTKRPSERRRLDPRSGRVEGGKPLPAGHLSNVKLSSQDLRVYGRRLLRK